MPAHASVQAARSSRAGAELEPVGAIDPVERLRVVEAVGQPGRVREQMPDPHRLGRRHRDRLVLAAAGPHARVGEARDEARDRVLELERALLPQQHRRHRRDRLGHRVDPPQRVRLHRQPGLHVAQPAAWRRARRARRARSRPGSRAAARRPRSGRSGGRCARRRCASKPASAGSISTGARGGSCPTRRASSASRAKSASATSGRGDDVERPRTHLVQQRRWDGLARRYM